MSSSSQPPLRLQPAPDSATVEMLHQIFGDVLIPLEELRERYFRNLSEKTFSEAINSGRIQLPVTTIDHSVKALRYAHIRHVAALIDIRAYQADEDMPRPPTDSKAQRNVTSQ
ncbi:pyocin activator PrtN family protein [Pseudomonas sp. UYIF39]|uniref:pyocin activator PrtN family protein n=1 Tax=Pseudomonas sp. UYIF39 TaxID=1630747 RepID=UPI00249EF7EB|nr:pyocin activator PrtN family protein [Pseudomonas sp. UYIF39]MDI3357111.1 pyocin activator PrtN family protein [Pseudomonas sp. UYIF39]